MHLHLAWLKHSGAFSHTKVTDNGDSVVLCGRHKTISEYRQIASVLVVVTQSFSLWVPKVSKS